MSSHDDIRRRVRALLSRANHEGTPQAEAESALALAYRLMVKYDLDERELSQHETPGHGGSLDAIVSRTYRTTGPYRVRRYDIRYRIADALSCAVLRDHVAGDADTVVSVIYGTAADLDAMEVIYEAAELLALRTIPHGDRSFRTSWFQGFASGVWRKLMQERRTLERTHQGAAIVLKERLDRAVYVMEHEQTDLRIAREDGVTWAGAYEDGRDAGLRISTGRRDVAGGMRALPRGD
jgi:hypothetical protein